MADPTLTATTPRDGRETKVRAALSTKSEALAVINENEKFFTYREDTRWWKVSTAAGLAGHAHVSRVKVGGLRPFVWSLEAEIDTTEQRRLIV